MLATESADVMWNTIWAVQNDQHRRILVANETLLRAETKLDGGLERGTLVPHRGSEEAVTFETYLFYELTLYI